MLVLAAVLGIAAVVLLIVWLDVHPFLALILGAAVLGVVSGLGPTKTIDSFTKGVGSTAGAVGLLIALGAMIGALLFDSGGADRVVAAFVDRTSPRSLPWAMAAVAALVGLPLFFEVGVVLLVPVVLLVCLRSSAPVLKVGIPALAGLSVLHGLVPPHPGPLVAIDALKADLGLTLLFGIIIAIPTVIVAGPLFGSWIGRRIVLDPRAIRAGLDVGDVSDAAAPAPSAPSARLSTPDAQGDARGPADARSTISAEGTAAGGRTGTLTEAAPATRTRTPSTAAAITVLLLPVVLMLARAVAELTLADGTGVRPALELAGTPVVALLAGTIAGMLLLGIPAGMDRTRISATVGGALPGIAGILLIVAAGGGFKQTLVDAGVADVIGDWAKAASLSPLVLGWLVAVGIRLATGSATVATITAAGLVSPLVTDMSRPEVSLLVLAIGAGSLFFSHVNDAGFWLVKEYFGMTVGQTIRSWSVMETLISVVGLLGVLVISVAV